MLDTDGVHVVEPVSGVPRHVLGEMNLVTKPSRERTSSAPMPSGWGR